MMETDSKAFVVTWTIENFLFCSQKSGEKLSSPEFMVSGVDNVKWQLRLFPRGEQNEKYISLFLEKVKNTEDPNNGAVTIEYELSYVLCRKEEIRLRRLQKEFKNETLTWGLHKFLRRSEIVNKLGKLASQAGFTIRCRIWVPSDLTRKTAYCSIRTRIGIKRCAFVWVLGEFAEDQLHEKKSIVVPFATSKDLPVTLTSFITYGPKCNEELNVEMKLHCTSHCFVWYKMSLVDENGSVEQSNEEEHWMKKSGNTVRKLSSFAFCEESSLEYFSKGNRKLVCDLVLSAGVVHEGVEETLCDHDYLKTLCPSLIPEYVDEIVSLDSDDSDSSYEDAETTEDSEDTGTLKSDMQFMHKDNMMCDTKLRSHTSVFPTHRAILCARSPVFRAMFAAEMMEKRSDSVDIADLEDDTIRHMLQFLYTDSVEELDMHGAKKLYYAADKYQIVRLKRKCGEFLAENLEVSNVCKVLKLADLHQDDYLKNSSMDFILSSCKSVFESEQWKTFMNKNSRLAVEVMYIRYTKEC